MNLVTSTRNLETKYILFHEEFSSLGRKMVLYLTSDNVSVCFFSRFSQRLTQYHVRSFEPLSSSIWTAAQ